MLVSVTSGGHGRNGSQDLSAGGTPNNEMIHGSQVVAVGTPLPTASLPLGAQQGPVMVSSQVVIMATLTYL